MKRLLIALLCLLCLMGFASCGKDDGTISITDDRWFAEQIHDIQLNPRKYVRETIHISGLYSDVNENGQQADFVYRVLGCCGADDVLGLAFEWDGEPPQLYSFIEVTGTAAVKNGRVVLVDVTLKQEGLS